MVKHSDNTQWKSIRGAIKLSQAETLIEKFRLALLYDNRVSIKVQGSLVSGFMKRDVVELSTEVINTGTSIDPFVY